MMNETPRTKTMNQHGDALEWNGVGFLIVGPPNSGKSETALALIEQGAQLIADDQVLLNGITATCPEPIKGLLHTRAGGFFKLPFITQTEIRVIFQSPIPAPPLSRPPALGVPIHVVDLRSADAKDVIYDIISNL